MKILKIIAMGIAWFGILLMIFGIWGIARITTLDLTYSFEQLRGPIIHGWDYFLLGLILSSIGGLVGKPRYLWLILNILGVICFLLVVIDSIVQMHNFQYSISYAFFIKMLSGITCIVVGFLIRNLRMKQNPKTDT